MKRKINRVGTNTLTVSLPSAWTKKYNISPGDEINLKEEGKNIVLGIAKSNEKRNLFLNIKDSEKFMTRLICGPYLKGYEEVTIKYQDSKVYGKLLSSLRHTMGFEVVNQSEGRCMIKELVQGDEQNFEKLIIRLFNVLRSFATELNKYLKKPYEDINSLLEIEYTCDKLSLYCKRLVNKDLVSGKTYDNTAMYHIVALAEQVGDELRQIAQFFKKKGHKNFKYNVEFDDLFKKLDKSLELTMKKVDNYMNDLNHEKQIELAFQQRLIREEFMNSKFELLRGGEYHIIIGHHLINSIELIQHMSEELF